MAFTQSWNEGSPVGTDLVNTADEEFRNLKAAIRERLSQIVGKELSGAMNTDPIIAPGYGILNPKRFYRFFEHIFTPRTPTGGFSISSFGVISDSQPGSQMGFNIPLDVTGYSVLNSIKVYYKRPTNSVGSSMSLYKCTYNLSSLTLISSVTLPVGDKTVTPYTWSAFGPLTIDPGFSWVLIVDYQNHATSPSDSQTMNGVEFVYA